MKFMLLAILILVSGRAFAQSANPNTIASVAHVDIMPQDTKKVADAFKAYLVNCPKERGALEVRVLQQIGAPNHFTIVEIWSDKKAYDDHLAAKATRDFRRAIAASLGSPYDERLHTEALNFGE